MLGLGLPQLILILAGLGFAVAGIYGLAPALVTARSGAGASGSSPVVPPAISKKQAKRDAHAAKIAEAKAQAVVKKEASMAPEASLAAPAPAATSEVAAPVLPATTPVAESSTADAVVMDQELVDELFAEMFALRATVSDLVGEVQQLRTEQKPRRFVIEELAS